MIKKPEIKFQESNEVQLIKQNYHNKVFPNTNNDSYKNTYVYNIITSYISQDFTKVDMEIFLHMIDIFPIFHKKILNISQSNPYLTQGVLGSILSLMDSTGDYFFIYIVILNEMKCEMNDLRSKYKIIDLVYSCINIKKLDNFANAKDCIKYIVSSSGLRVKIDDFITLTIKNMNIDLRSVKSRNFLQCIKEDLNSDEDFGLKVRCLLSMSRSLIVPVNKVNLKSIWELVNMGSIDKTTARIDEIKALASYNSIKSTECYL